MTSSLMFSMIPAASPATKANKIGAVGDRREKKQIELLKFWSDKLDWHRSVAEPRG